MHKDLPRPSEQRTPRTTRKGTDDTLKGEVPRRTRAGDGDWEGCRQEGRDRADHAAEPYR